MVAARQADEFGDTLLLLEHPHVFTLGRGADERFLLSQRPADVPVYRVSRGGQVTYHGPGQLIGYPILKLEGRDRDVHRYLRSIEEAMIRALADFDIEATRREGLTGIWVGSEKNRLDRRRHQALDDLPRLRAQRLSRPELLQRHRSVRHRRM